MTATSTTPMSLDQLQTEAATALDAMEPGKFGNRAYTVSVKLADGREVTLTLSDQKPAGWRNRHASIQRKAQWKLDGKVVSKLHIQQETGERRGMLDLNPALTAAFQAQAPQLAADFETFVRRLYEQLFAKFEGKIPAYPKRGTVDTYVHSDIRMVLDPVCTLQQNGSNRSEDWTLSLDESKLKAAAVKYGDDAAVQWLHKTNDKLGALEAPELVVDRNGYLVVTGKRAGRSISLNQQRILKRSPKGTLFHQFPAHLYVDSKFTTEEAYKKLFGDK